MIQAASIRTPLGVGNVTRLNISRMKNYNLKEWLL